MKLFTDTKDKYSKGMKKEAYNLFLSDETSVKGISFKSFCEKMDSILFLNNTKTSIKNEANF